MKVIDNGEGWEASMAARATQRAATALPDDRFVDQREREEAEQVRRRMDDMTLGDALHVLAVSVPCGCSGGPGCCVFWSWRARRLQHAAHIVARLLTDRVGSSVSTAGGAP